MDWQKNRLYIGGAVLLALIGIVTYVARSRSGDTTTAVGERPTLPDIDRADVTALDITRPAPSGEGEPEHVRLELHDGTWSVTQPLAALADQTAVDQALRKLEELAVSGTAATHADHHAELEVDDEHGVHIVVHGEGDDVIADLIVGAFRGGNTMVRVAGQDTVVTVAGSIRSVFAHDLKDWRNRSMLAMEPDTIQVADWTGPNGTFHFARPVLPAEPPPPPPEGADPDEGDEADVPHVRFGDWAPTEVSYVPAAEGDAGVALAPAAPLTAIPDFSSSRVASLVSALAHMRAQDFAAVGIDRTAAGITDASAHVTLVHGSGTSAERHTITVGTEASSGNFYAVRDDDPTVFVVSHFLMEKVSPNAAAFAQAAAAAAPEEDPDAPAPMPGGGGGEIPPDLMRQIQAQLQAQGMGGGAP